MLFIVGCLRLSAAFQVLLVSTNTQRDTTSITKEKKIKVTLKISRRLSPVRILIIILLQQRPRLLRLKDLQESLLVCTMQALQCLLINQSSLLRMIKDLKLKPCKFKSRFPYLTKWTTRRNQKMQS